MTALGLHAARTRRRREEIAISHPVAHRVQEAARGGVAEARRASQSTPAVEGAWADRRSRGVPGGVHRGHVPGDRGPPGREGRRRAGGPRRGQGLGRRAGVYEQRCAALGRAARAVVRSALVRPAPASASAGRQAPAKPPLEQGGQVRWIRLAQACGRPGAEHGRQGRGAPAPGVQQRPGRIGREGLDTQRARERHVGAVEAVRPDQVGAPRRGRGRRGRRPPPALQAPPPPNRRAVGAGAAPRAAEPAGDQQPGQRRSWTSTAALVSNASANRWSRMAIMRLLGSSCKPWKVARPHLRVPSGGRVPGRASAWSGKSVVRRSESWPRRRHCRWPR